MFPALFDKTGINSENVFDKNYSRLVFLKRNKTKYLFFHLRITSRRLLEGAEVKFYVFQTNRMKSEEEEKEIVVIVMVDVESTTNSGGGQTDTFCCPERNIFIGYKGS